MNTRIMLEELQILREIVEGLEHIMNNSSGVNGWHYNGDEAYWGEFDLYHSVNAYYEYYRKEGE